MERKTMSQVLAEEIENTRNEVRRIDEMFRIRGIVPYDNDLYTLDDYVDRFCFSRWKGRRHCLDVNDFLKTVHYDELLNELSAADSNDGDNHSIENFVSFIEIVYNFWKIVNKEPGYDDREFRAFDEYNHLHLIMKEDLSHFNYIAKYDEETEQVIIIEDKPEVTAVAERVEPGFGREIVRYNHYSLKGDIEAKKSILLRLGNEIEPKRGALERVNENLSDDIFFMLNNMNIRHNNFDSNSANFNSYVSQMEKSQLECWYDELYQMILLAFLELDQKGRHAELKSLKEKNKMQNSNG